MTQVWLVLIALFLTQAANHAMYRATRAALIKVGMFFVVLSIVLFFVNGGTTG